jgi:hypothetical protein
MTTEEIKAICDFYAGDEMAQAYKDLTRRLFTSERIDALEMMHGLLQAPLCSYFNKHYQHKIGPEFIPERIVRFLQRSQLAQCHMHMSFVTVVSRMVMTPRIKGLLAKWHLQ